MSTFSDALQVYLDHHQGPHFPAKETVVESPLQWLLELAWEHKITNNHNAAQAAATEELG